MHESHYESRDAGIAKLRELIKGIPTAMLTCVAEDGSIHSRPMATRELEPDGDLLFFTRFDSGKIAELRRDSRVGVVYADTHDHRYISVTGKAELVRDTAKVTALWKPSLKPWFPEGPTDPSLALLRIHVERAEYWDMKSSRLILFIGIAKAIATGKAYEAEAIDHAKFTLS